MSSKPESYLVSLPRWEIALYWLLSLASHLYSFYELHRFSKEHERGLDREFPLEKGFIGGLKRDAADFEWSFWSDWARRSLLWSLLGHAVLSRLASIYLPQWHLAILTGYGVLAACNLLGLRGVAVLMLQLSLSLAVAQLHNPALCWGSSLLLLSTLHISSLQDIQMLRPCAGVCGVSAVCVLKSAVRVCVWWCVAETLIHCMHMHSIQGNETYLEILPPWALGGLALGLVQFFYVKYLVLFGLPSLLVRMDGVEPPQLPRCVSIMYSFTGMWRHFDVGLYRWLIRYIYVPLGGSRHGVLRKVLSTALAFVFVCFWHGGHDYLQQWALLNWAGILVENALGMLLTAPPLRHLIERVLSPPMRRRGLAFVSAFSTGLLILSNLIFLGGNHVGRIFWKRVFVQGWSNMAIPMLGFLYCFAQVGLEWDRKAR
ncbi:protein-cysteine N-palmitoyltransferase HHAT isoform X2 [Sardina pilchardus]|uniref:protein-cysteine N-palmitoyltransferase HHAT isoform X2 n=1 Tax=Sardina pilchardus TaxID=27697 RepID=UPI002E122BEA